jgi:hypothetical protein
LTPICLLCHTDTDSLTVPASEPSGEISPARISAIHPHCLLPQAPKVRIVNPIDGESPFMRKDRADRAERRGECKYVDLKQTRVFFIRTTPQQINRDLAALSCQTYVDRSIERMATRQGIKRLPIAGDVTNLTLRRRPLKP